MTFYSYFRHKEVPIVTFESLYEAKPRNSFFEQGFGHFLCLFCTSWRCFYPPCESINEDQQVHTVICSRLVSGFCLSSEGFQLSLQDEVLKLTCKISHTAAVCADLPASVLPLLTRLSSDIPSSVWASLPGVPALPAGPLMALFHI